MDFTQFETLLYKYFEENGLSNLLVQDKSKKLYDFANILIETNKQMNLTAITGVEDVIFKHFVDCARVERHFLKGKTVIDVGCGAGFPSMPLAILRPDLEVVALDSTSKKIVFITNTSKVLKINNISAISARAEEFAEENRERFDYATSRAVARLNILSELCMPLIKVGGCFVPMKASKAQEEIDEAIKGICTLGGSLVKADPYTLVHDQETLERHTFIISKTHATPKAYPRKYAQILKKPL